jgi:hypothetical protein
VDRLIRKALMRGANDKNIKEVEDEYLRGVYGNLFDKTKEAEHDSLIAVFETENHCIIRFMR